MVPIKKIGSVLFMFVLGMVISVAQTKKSKGDLFFFQYEYQKAVNAYEAQLANGTLTPKQFLNLADAYFQTNNFEKASEAYLDLYKRDTLMDGHHYNKMLQSFSKTTDKERKTAFLATMSNDFPKELMENMDFNNQLLQSASANSGLDYVIFNLD
ncbi:MAG: tetratricopeptide repeat protein [Bacteroidota bacterium]|nr:tetratricopeptide repeat protein [Bacteroidota bacterium]